MGKTHEALKRAEEEYQKNVVVATESSQRALIPYRAPRDLLQPTPRWYQELKSRLQIQYPDESLKTILFTGTSHKAGASMTAKGYAECLANDYQFKVLLIEIDLDNKPSDKPDAVNQPHRLSKMFSGHSQFDADPGKNPNGNLFTVSCTQEALGPAGPFQSNQFDEFLESMRASFDYIILDAPPVTQFSETRMMCNKVNGTILVLEFGKTRKQVAYKVKQELEAAGGNFLGVVINKRQYYIPKWIYKRL